MIIVVIELELEPVASRESQVVPSKGMKSIGKARLDIVQRTHQEGAFFS